MPTYLECYQHEDDVNTMAQVFDVHKDYSTDTQQVTYVTEYVDTVGDNRQSNNTRDLDSFRTLYKKADCIKYKKLYYERLFYEMQKQRDDLLKSKGCQ